MVCEQECTQRCKNDRNIVITKHVIYDSDDSNFTVATNDPDVVVEIVAVVYGTEMFSKLLTE